MVTLKQRIFIKVFVMIFFLISCGGREYKKIELSALNPILRKTSDQITDDFFKLCTHHEGLMEFKRKDYITPMVHAGIMSLNGIYAYAPEILEMNLGKVFSWKLYQVVDKGVVKAMRYKIDCEKRKDEFVEFRIDMNKENKLASIYIYVYTDETKKAKKNLFFK
jgi:hypothetical protein